MLVSVEPRTIQHEM